MDQGISDFAGKSNGADDLAPTRWYSNPLSTLTIFTRRKRGTSSNSFRRTTFFDHDDFSSIHDDL